MSRKESVPLCCMPQDLRQCEAHLDNQKAFVISKRHFRRAAFNSVDSQCDFIQLLPLRAIAALCFAVRESFTSAFGVSLSSLHSPAITVQLLFLAARYFVLGHFIGNS